MGNISDIKKDLPMSMTMAAFFGISWYIGVEINISLFSLFKRRRGPYFWSCLLVCWGVILQPLFILLADFKIWTNLKGSITMIYMTWLILVVPQSWILYSRLHFIVHQQKFLRWLMAVLLFNTIGFSVPTIVIGILSQVKTTDLYLSHVNKIWDRLQLTVFFTQETILSILYIYQTQKHLRNWSQLLTINHPPSSSSSTHSAASEKSVLYHLIIMNLLVIALDIALLAIEYADLFYLQGAFKPCVYGIKLKVEYLVLNRLVQSVRARGGGSGGSTNRNGAPAMLLQGPAGVCTSPLQSKSSGEGNERRPHQQRVGLDLLDKGGKKLIRPRSRESQAPILKENDGGGGGDWRGESTTNQNGNNGAFWSR